MDSQPESSGPVAPFKSALRSMEPNHKAMTILRCKLCIVGDAACGKTALAGTFHSNLYPKNYVMTIGVDFSVKQVPMQDSDVIVELFLLDCAGQSIFNQVEMNAPHWESTSALMIVFDIGNRDSFLSCGKWLQSVRSAIASASGGVAPSNLPVVLVGNKSDFRTTGGAGGGMVVEEGRAVVTRQEAETLASSMGAAYFETSAQESEGVAAPFMHIAQDFQRRYGETVERAEEYAAGGM